MDVKCKMWGVGLGYAGKLGQVSPDGEVSFVWNIHITYGVKEGVTFRFKLWF